MDMSKKFEMLAKEVRECKRCSECPLNVNQNCGFNFIDCCTYCTAEDIEFFYENSKKLIQTLEKNIEEPILDEVEKEYLKNVLAPWLRNKKIVITKQNNFNSTVEWLDIDIYSKDDDCLDGISFPDFPAGKMYAGMEIDKEYTAEELGLQ